MTCDGCAHPDGWDECSKDEWNNCFNGPADEEGFALDPNDCSRGIDEANESSCLDGAQ